MEAIVSSIQSVPKGTWFGIGILGILIVAGLIINFYFRKAIVDIEKRSQILVKTEKATKKFSRELIAILNVMGNSPNLKSVVINLGFAVTISSFGKPIFDEARELRDEPVLGEDIRFELALLKQNNPKFLDRFWRFVDMAAETMIFTYGTDNEQALDKEKLVSVICRYVAPDTSNMVADLRKFAGG